MTEQTLEANDVMHLGREKWEQKSCFDVPGSYIVNGGSMVGKWVLTPIYPIYK